MSEFPLTVSQTIETTIAMVVTLSFFVMSFATLRERHKDGDGWHVHVGALIYGALFGAIVGFVLAPVRIALVSGQLPASMAAPYGVGFLVIMIAMRRGLLARLPFLGPQVRAYRRASLRRAIEVAQKQLDKLGPSRGTMVEGAA